LTPTGVRTAPTMYASATGISPILATNRLFRRYRGRQDRVNHWSGASFSAASW
jgi:hypothetical protein